MKAFEESQILLEDFATGGSSEDLIEDLQGQLVEVESLNFNLKAEKEAMSQAIKKMVTILPLLDANGVMT